MQVTLFISTLLPWTSQLVNTASFKPQCFQLIYIKHHQVTYIVSGRKMTFSWFLARLVSYAHIPVSWLPAFCRRLYAAPPHSADPITIRNSSWILNLLVIVNWDPFLSWNRGRLASCSPYLHIWKEPNKYQSLVLCIYSSILKYDFAALHFLTKPCHDSCSAKVWN